MSFDFLGLASGLLGSASGFAGGMMSYKSAKRLQDQQNAFTERMSNTAYRRATTDMRAAGLNPALMYGSGSSASTPVAGNSSGVDFDVGDPVNSAMNIKQARANIQATQANAAYAREQAKTEENKRFNLDADSALKTATKIATETKLPYETRKMAAEAQNLISQSLLNNEIRKYTGYNAESNRIQANAAKTNAAASGRQAEASYLSATEGNPFRTTLHYGKKMFNSEFGKYFFGNRYGRDGHW